MICHCGKPVWGYNSHTLTCKNGHHTPIEGAVVERIASPEPPPPPPRFTVAPWMVAVASGAGTSLALFIVDHLF